MLWIGITVGAIALSVMGIYIKLKKSRLSQAAKKDLFFRFLIVGMITLIIAIIIISTSIMERMNITDLGLGVIAILIVIGLIFFWTSSKLKTNKLNWVRFALKLIGGLALLLLVLIPSVRYNFSIVVTLAIVVVVGFLSDFILGLIEKRKN